jgi:hypothetical protein
MVCLYTQLVVCPIKHDPVIKYYGVEGACHPNVCTVALQPLLLCMKEHDTFFVQIIHLRSTDPCFRSKSIFSNSLNSPRFMEPECLLTFLLEPATYPRLNHIHSLHVPSPCFFNIVMCFLIFCTTFL